MLQFYVFLCYSFTCFCVTLLSVCNVTVLRVCNVTFFRVCKVAVLRVFVLQFYVFVMLQFYVYRLRPVRRRHVSCHRPYVPAVQSGQAVPHSIRCKDLVR